MVTVVANQKGGVGKTTTAANLGALGAARGGRVLLVDCDPQSALTRQLGLDVASLRVSLVDLLAGRVSPVDAIVAEVHGCDVLPAAGGLAGVEMSLVGELGDRHAPEPGVVDGQCAGVRRRRSGASHKLGLAQRPRPQSASQAGQQHLPTSLKQLEKAIAQTHADHDQAITRTHDQPAEPADDPGRDDETDTEIGDDTVDDPDADHGSPDQQPDE